MPLTIGGIITVHNLYPQRLCKLYSAQGEYCICTHRGGGEDRDHQTNLGLSHVWTVFRTLIDERISLFSFRKAKEVPSSSTGVWVGFPSKGGIFISCSVYYYRYYGLVVWYYQLYMKIFFIMFFIPWSIVSYWNHFFFVSRRINWSLYRLKYIIM